MSWPPPAALGAVDATALGAVDAEAGVDDGEGIWPLHAATRMTPSASVRARIRMVLLLQTFRAGTATSPSGRRRPGSVLSEIPNFKYERWSHADRTRTNQTVGQARSRCRTFRVIRDTASSTRIDDDHVIDPTENTRPPFEFSW